MAEIPALLEKLLRPAAPSGHEAPAAAVWREAASFAELSSDGLGSSIARVGDAAPLLAVVGHIDEIGLMVTHIDDDGFLRVLGVGGWDAQVLIGSGSSWKAGPLPAVVGRGASTCCARTSATRCRSCASCTWTSARRAATRRAGWCGSATSP